MFHLAAQKQSREGELCERSINVSQGSCCTKGCVVGVPEWQLCGAAGAASGVQALQVQGLCRAIPDTPVHPHTVPAALSSSQLLFRPRAGGSYTQGALGTRGDVTFRVREEPSRVGLLLETSAQVPSTFQCTPWHLCVVKGKGNQYLCMFFPPKM